MTVRFRLLTFGLLGIIVVGAAAALSGLPSGLPGPTGAALASSQPGASGGGIALEPTPVPTPTPRPSLGGTELYGYLPYWQMNATVATYLRSAPLTTLALFSVTARTTGAIDTRPLGYRRINGSIGQRLIAEAHARGTRVELVFAVFGGDKNAQFFGGIVPAATPGPAAPTLPPPSGTAAPPGSSVGPPAPLPSGATEPVAPWHRTVGELIALATRLGVDGINVDIEQLQDQNRPAYGEFLAALRTALVAANPNAHLTVATEAGARGVANAATAFAAGVDRLFLMGYDYHWGGSQPGASAPIDRLDGTATLRWSIDQYVEAGVPRDRILLGLPLYGMQWRTTGPLRTYPVIGSGITWIPSQHRDLLLDPAFQPDRDLYEHAEYFDVSDGRDWLITYYDSPATLRPKLGLARDNGLAGAGFWAMGYERGLPGYLELMTAFRAGAISRDEAPPRPSAQP
ncbi:MAG TPA: glycosyl hydrolase family 18 protein [Candidatus Dormibacteraeota bacterium]|nr:glycosyl hydrolase family 18 protein [Candidatus Dormibacteraeota bacterium]